jgi:hypothetical protein
MLAPHSEVSPRPTLQLTAGAAVPWAPTLRIALGVGLAAALIEMLFVLPIQAYLGASPLVVFQSIASGALGAAAFRGGLAAAALGGAVHVLISVVAALVFVLAALRWRRLQRRPAVSAVVYGGLLYLFMTLIVIPLSAIGFRPPRSLFLMLVSIAIHMFAFALPITLLVGARLRGAA